MKKIFRLKFMLLILLASCDKNPIDSEQYIKQVYLIGAQDVTKTIVLPYTVGAAETFVTVSTSGSKAIDQDVNVELQIVPELITSYNEKFYEIDETDKHLKLLASNLVDIPALNRLKINSSEEIYANLPMFIKTESFHPDSIYALPLKIMRVDNYEINPALDELIVVFSLENNFSGNYGMTGNRTRNDTGTNTKLQKNKSMKAVGVNKIRMFHTDVAETTDIADNGIVLEIKDDNTVVVTSWDNLENVSGGGIYMPSEKIFDLTYEYTANGVTFQVNETLSLIR